MTHHDPNNRIEPPSAEEIERMFESRRARVMRPVMRGGIEALKRARKLTWVAEGFEHFEPLDLPVILAANHTSHVDTSAILDVLPKHVRDRTVVAAALDVFSPDERVGVHAVPRLCLQWTVASAFHAFAFDRFAAPMRSIRTAVQLVRNDWSLLLFPEGTRSRTGELGDFKQGVGVMARFTKRPVVPIHVSGGLNVLPPGATIPREGKVLVRFGKPLQYQKTDTPEAFAQRLRARVLELQPEGYLESIPSIDEASLAIRHGY